MVINKSSIWGKMVALSAYLRQILQGRAAASLTSRLAQLVALASPSAHEASASSVSIAAPGQRTLNPCVSHRAPDCASTSGTVDRFRHVAANSCPTLCNESPLRVQNSILGRATPRLRQFPPNMAHVISMTAALSALMALAAPRHVPSLMVLATLRSLETNHVG